MSFSSFFLGGGEKQESMGCMGKLGQNTVWHNMFTFNIEHNCLKIIMIKQINENLKSSVSQQHTA